MKKFLISFLIIAYAMVNPTATSTTIPKESIRFRVIPNSNTVEDLYMKEKVKEEVERTIIVNSNLKDINEERKLIINNLSTLENNISDLFTLNNYNESFKVKYGYNYFPEKEYAGKTYKEGDYESLVIEIGAAEGDNYWCVLFPPFCLMEAEETNTEKVEYDSYILKLINNVIK